MKKPVIIGTGFALPDQIWDNHRLETLVDTSDEWIQTRTGVVTRRIAEPHESTATLGAKAARAALKRAGIEPTEIDVVICATMSPEMPFPATACFIQDMIGATNAAAFDISAACTGFIYGLSVASSMITAGLARHVLLIGAEVLSRVVDWTDRNSCVIFGDGAGAAVISHTGEGGEIIDSVIHADGSRTDLLNMPAGGTRLPTTEQTVRDRMHYLKMTGKGLYKEATTSMADAVREVLGRNNLTLDDMGILIPHQANLRIILSTANRLGIDPSRAFVNIDRYGNTSAATIPIALTEALDQGRIEPGSAVVLTAFGSGMTWGATLVRY